jgi:hypothetical protein
MYDYMYLILTYMSLRFPGTLPRKVRRHGPRDPRLAQLYFKTDHHKSNDGNDKANSSSSSVRVVAGKLRIYYYNIRVEDNDNEVRLRRRGISKQL